VYSKSNICPGSKIIAAGRTVACDGGSIMPSRATARHSTGFVAIEEL
jgi:hypothetical protein